MVSVERWDMGYLKILIKFVVAISFLLYDNCN